MAMNKFRLWYSDQVVDRSEKAASKQKQKEREATTGTKLAAADCC
jgi:hypothetical protein